MAEARSREARAGDKAMTEHDLTIILGCILGSVLGIIIGNLVRR